MNNASQRYQVLQGEISHLHTENINVHYLKNIKRQQEVAGAVAVLQAAVGQAGAVNSAQAATDEGDPVESFSMRVSWKTVRGSFWKTTFKNGDNVSVVGQKRAGVFEAVAIVKPDERMIWMQPHCERGTVAQKRNLIKCFSWFILFTLFCALLLVLWRGWPMWAALLTLSVSAVLMLFVTVGMSWGDFMSFAREMNAVGKVLDLPEPETVDLFKSTKLARENGRPEVPMGVYYY